MKLKDKVALVTGANRGIGRAIAVRLAEEGAKVVVNHPNSDSEAEALETVTAISATGQEALAIKADISIVKEIDRMFAEAAARFGRLDVLVNNAGFDPGETKLLEVDEALYDQVMNTNLKGAYFCIQAAVREMARGGYGGKIINISSVQARASIERRSIYAATKGGLNSLTRQLALDLAKHCININAVAPGFIEVERTMRSTENYNRAAKGQTIPWGRVGFPDDISSMVVFLATPEADFITGQIITVDGGTTCKLAR